MARIAFDNEKYLQMQSAHIRDRIAKFGGKLYLEFGGKLFDDYHAARVLPGFAADSKLQMLMQLADQAEIVMVVSVEDIIKNKVREYLYKLEEVYGDDMGNMFLNELFALFALAAPEPFFTTTTFFPPEEPEPELEPPAEALLVGALFAPVPARLAASLFKESPILRLSTSS